MTTRRARTLLLALLAAFALFTAACGDDDGDAATTTTAAPAAPGTDTGSDEGGDAIAGDPASGDLLDTLAGEDADAVRDAVDLDSIVRALERALDAEEIRLDGDTLHITLPADGQNPTVACLAADSSLGMFDYELDIVLHTADGQDIDC
jgi:hypothetical protein